MRTGLRARVNDMASKGDHAGIISACRQALLSPLPREERIFALLNYAQHLSALNPLAWVSQITSSLEDALGEVEDSKLKAAILAALSAAAVPLRIPAQVEVILRRFEDLAIRFPDVARSAAAADIHYNLGYCYEMARDLAGAEVQYGLAIQIYRDSGADRKIDETLHNLAHVYVRSGRVAEARAIVNVLQFSDPVGQAKLLCLKGKVFHAEGAFGEAEICFTQALELADVQTRIDILQAWAELALAQGNTEQAAEKAKTGLHLAYQMPYPEAAEALEAIITKIGGGGT